MLMQHTLRHDHVTGRDATIVTWTNPPLQQASCTSMPSPPALRCLVRTTKTLRWAAILLIGFFLIRLGSFPREALHTTDLYRASVPPLKSVNYAHLDDADFAHLTQSLISNSHDWVTHEERLFERLTATNDSFHLQFPLAGCLMTDSIQSCNDDVQTEMMTSLVQILSMTFTDNVRRKWVDPPADNNMYLLSPALLNNTNSITVFTRIMLDRMRFRFTNPRRFPVNQFMTNYIYQQDLDPQSLLPIGSGQMLGIPAPIDPFSGDGPMDPRAFKVNNRAYLLALTNMDVDDKPWRPYPLLWDLDKSEILIPKINLTFNPRIPMEKNWTPLVIGDNLYFVHNLDPLRVMSCDLVDLNCHVIHDDSVTKFKKYFKFDRKKHSLRGGTPFVHYDGDYFISIAHSVVIDNCTKAPYGKVRRYEANIVVLRANKQFRLVYVSKPVHFHRKLLSNISMVYYQGQILVVNDFFYPVSLIKESMDSFLVAGHIKDHISVLVRMRGMQELMKSVMAADNHMQMNVSPFLAQNYIRSAFDNLTVCQS